jgi:hypothetical protein
MTGNKMPDNHITGLLEEKPLAGLSPDEISGIELHAAECSECRREYYAARVAALLIRERVAEASEVSPFFKTRVMATIRERQLSSEGPALLKMWRAARALVLAMATLVVILTALTIFSQSGEEQLALAVAESVSIYSPEYVLMEEGDVDGDSLIYDQVLATIYDAGDADEQ